MGVTCVLIAEPLACQEDHPRGTRTDRRERRERGEKDWATKKPRFFLITCSTLLQLPPPFLPLSLSLSLSLASFQTLFSSPKLRGKMYHPSLISFSLLVSHLLCFRFCVLILPLSFSFPGLREAGAPHEAGVWQARCGPKKLKDLKKRGEERRQKRGSWNRRQRVSK